MLAHAYNIAIPFSTFSMSAIKLNDNLKDLWEYDIFLLSDKFISFYQHLFRMDIKNKIHTMKPSDEYIFNMFNWRRSKNQIKLILENNCPFDFVLTKTNI